MKYYLDEDLSPKIADILLKEGVDAVSMAGPGGLAAGDEVHLENAGNAGRCLVTRNRDDFIELTVQFFRDRRAHAGLLIVPYSYAGDCFSLIADALAEYAGAHQSGMMPYTIDFLPAPKVSRRRKR